MLVRPAAGTWTVSTARGSGSFPTRIDRATLQVPPTFAARVLGKSGLRTVRVAYAVPVGTSVRLIERAKGINHTIAARLALRPDNRPRTCDLDQGQCAVSRPHQQEVALGQAL
jgi:hypothetical protein